MRKTCLNMVYELARADRRVAFVGSDLGPGLLAEMKATLPERWFMEGVAEQGVVGMAAGLAMEGFVPYVNTIATFLTRRCFEQLAVDLCLHRLPVRLIGNGGGLVYAPLGPTHLAIEDLAITRALPEMTVVAPADAVEMRAFMAASLEIPGPVYIRLGKGGDPVVTPQDHRFELGAARLLRAPDRVTFLTTGVMGHRCLAAAEVLGDVGVVHFPTVKPLDRAALIAVAAASEALVTVEEHSLAGGFGSAVLETLADAPGGVPPLLRLGLPDRFPEGYGSQDDMLARYGLQPDGLVAAVRAWRNRELG